MHVVVALVLLVGLLAPATSPGVASAAVAIAVPNGDAAVQWTANAGTFDGTCGTRTAHCWRVDDGPTPTTADYLGTGLKGSTGETLDFHMSSPAQVSAVTSLTLHMYVRDADGKAQGGQFDSIDMSIAFPTGTLAASQKVIGSGSWSWQSATWTGTFTSAQIEGMRARFTRVRHGSGKVADQDDDIQIASVHVEVAHASPGSYELSSYRWFENTDVAAPGVDTYVRALGRADFEEYGQAMTALADGSIVMASYGQPTYAGSANDIFLTKVSPSGVEQWTSTLAVAPGSDDTAHDVVATRDGGFVVVGDTTAYDGTRQDLLIAKFDGDGVEQWSRTFGSASAYDVGMGIIELADGSLVFTGWQQTLVPGNIDIIVSRISADGSTVHWTTTLGGASWDIGHELAELADGSLIILGKGASYTNGSDDVFLSKLSPSGVEIWSTHVGSSSRQAGFAVTPLSDGGFAVAGMHATSGGDDAMLMTFSATGQELWTSTIGGPGSDWGYEVVEMAGGELMLAGFTASNANGNGIEEAFVSRFSPAGAELWSRTIGGTGYDRVQAMTRAPSGHLVLGGYTRSWGTGGAAGISDADLLLIQMTPDGTITGCPTTVCDDWHVTHTSLAFTDPAPPLTISETDRGITLTARALDSTDYSPATVETVVVADPGSAVPMPSTPLAAQDAAATIMSAGQQVRLRVTLHASEASATTGSDRFTLQQARRGSDSSCDPASVGEAYVDVTSGGPISVHDNPPWADGTRTAVAAGDPVHAGHSTIAQTYEEDAAFHVVAPLGAGQDGLWDFSLRVADAQPGDVHCFRIVRADGTSLLAPTVVPQLVIGTS
jgi:hypothetical protein